MTLSNILMSACLGVAVLLTPIQASAKVAPVTVLTAQEAQQKIKSQPVIILDVRTPEEYQMGHVPNAINVPLQNLQVGEKIQAIPNEDSTVLVYCRSGRRSAVAATILTRSGYQNVFDFGGILDWPYELER